MLGDSLENWLYPLASMSAYTLTRLRQPSLRDLLNIDLGHLSDDLMFRMTGTLEQSFKSVLRRNKASGVDRIARTADFTTKIRQAVVSQSRYRIEG
ncbi:hypothetical protein [Streptomyces hirsutus]|uniref:hypothetical protein n=1 Tax=Streptomyces hirsutus TaxID=35620 RepID=UPI00200EA392|nr:hypothetical protein [Streptomyces hirsutus]